MDRMIMLPTHQEKISSGQHGYVNAGVGKPRANIFQLCWWQQRKLCHMADGDTATQTVPLREFDHIVDVQVLGSRADIKMHINIDIEFSSKLKNT